VRPLYVEAEQTRVPELKKVIVAYGNRVVMRDTLQESLVALFGEAPETLEEGLDPDAAIPDVTEGADPDVETVLELLLAANQSFERAEQALRDGDLAAYANHVEEARRLVRLAEEISRPPELEPAAEPEVDPTGISGES
jgi:uncharacterized protein